MTDAAQEFAARMLAPFGPTKPIAELVVEVNRLFHAQEADHYDDDHPEIREQLPKIWRELLDLAVAKPPSAWRLLDFGCGTGFASEQVAARLGAKEIKEALCYDLSPHMLARCREHLATLLPQATFVEKLPSVGAFSLLVTNSVLHHLPDVEGTIATLEPLLAPDAWWIQGHEPSSRFYQNAELRKMYDDYLAQNRWGRFLRPSRYWGALKRLFGGDPRRYAAREAVRLGLFAREPDPDTIDRLVDFGVAHSAEEVAAGRGLDPRVLEKRLAGRWTLVAVRSYSFMGNFYEAKLPASWRERCRGLQERFPEDGANFCSVWRRVG